MMNKELYDYICYLLGKSRYVEIKLQGDFQNEDYMALIDRYNDFDLHEVTVDCDLYNGLKGVKISFAQVIE